MRALNQNHSDFGYVGKDLVGIKELADVLGIPRTTLTTWRTRTPGVAEPVAVLANGPIYDKWEFLLAWNDSVPDRRKPGHLSEKDAYVLSALIDHLETENHENS